MQCRAGTFAAATGDRFRRATTLSRHVSRAGSCGCDCRRSAPSWVCTLGQATDGPAPFSVAEHLPPMLVRDSRTSSANGALGRHERQDSTEDEAWRIATNYSQAAGLAAPCGNVKQLRAGLNPGAYLFRMRAAQRCRRGRRFGLSTPVPVGTRPAWRRPSNQ